MSKETRSPNGDLWFERDATDDPIVNARDNLRYWEDRVMQGQRHKPVVLRDEEVRCLLNAVRHMIETIDKERADV